MSECQFAGDAALLATTREGVEQAKQEYIEVASSFGLKVSIRRPSEWWWDKQCRQKTGLQYRLETVKSSVWTSSPTWVPSYLLNGQTDAEVDRQIANASKTFAALRPAVFIDRNLNVNTKRQAYQACVLSVLMYSPECWTLLRRHVNRQNTFHHCCVRNILGITRQQQWEQHITSEQTREQ